MRLAIKQLLELKLLDCIAEMLNMANAHFEREQMFGILDP